MSYFQNCNKTYYFNIYIYLTIIQPIQRLTEKTLQLHNLYGKLQGL